jgi:hypothetical protein
MRLDLQKIDERIKKLQEIRKLASDPEAVTILLECITSEDEQSDGAPAIKDAAHGLNRKSSEASDLVADVIAGIEPQTGARKGKSWLG